MVFCFHSFILLYNFLKRKKLKLKPKNAIHGLSDKHTFLSLGSLAYF